MVLNATKNSLQLSSETIPQISSVQTEQQHRFDGGIMQLTEPGERQFSSFHWKASQQRKTRLHVKSSQNVSTMTSISTMWT